MLLHKPFHCACSAGYSYSRKEELADSLALRQERLRDMQGLPLCIRLTPVTSLLVGSRLGREILCWPVLPA